VALKILDNVKELGGSPVLVMDDLREKFPERFNASGAMDYEWFEKDIRPNYFVYVRRDKNSISFTLQDGPVKEVGVNGCQVEALIEASMWLIESLNEKIPCRENDLARADLWQALYWLNKRKEDREQRGVEGRSEP
jgi:hypothetical protein